MQRESIATKLVLSGIPSAALITATRRFVQEMYNGLLSDPETSARVALATHELMENLAKYASGGDGELEIGLIQRDGQDYVRIKTTNCATEAEVRELRRVLDQIRESRDPLKTYLEFIANSVASTGRSGLGLVRVRAEAEMDLSYSISKSQVTIVAETPVPPRAGGWAHPPCSRLVP
jgi:hypothetical protein